MMKRISKLPIGRKQKSVLTLLVMMLLSLTGGGGYLFWQCLPDPLFDTPYSTVLLDQDGKLLSASIAADEQWRFPPSPTIPENLERAIICYEDRRFFSHSGIDPLAFVRALWQNIRAGRVVSGASTITMQVIRLARQGQPRTLKEKLIEMLIALRLECSLSKQEILSLYAAHAPFGGNVVGIEAASWRYFGREPEQLTHAESAMLAVLPNNPALVHPGRNQTELKRKRDFLLDKLQEQGLIDALTCKLSKQESLPPKPHPIPMSAPHLLARIRKSSFPHGRVKTTLRKDLQVRATHILQRHHKRFAGNGIHNAAALILEVASGNVLAYVGNVSSGEHGSYVDIITASRSTGSILKPFLYAAMIDAGELLPSQLVPDVPTRMGSFAPENYSRTYQGAVPAYMALARSLNVPAVRLLRSYNVHRFSDFLKQLGMTSLHRPAREYGLSLILGGAEGSLWELTAIYAGMARRVNNYSTMDPDKPAFFPSKYVNMPNLAKVSKPSQDSPDNPLGAPACWLTFDAMLEVVRPGIDSAWRNFNSSHRIAWKTGTSYGHRDAWAIGVTPQYVVGVWVGNADGEGRPDLTGLSAAAPVLFELFELLDGNTWFERPEADLFEIEVCANSGYRAGPHCAHTKKVWVTQAGLHSKRCPYCQIIHCDATLQWRVHSDCEKVAMMKPLTYFVLPPAMEWFYKRNHSDYFSLPPYRPDCLESVTAPDTISMTLIYPDRNGNLYVPLELDGSRGRAIFEAAHRDAQTTIYWHLDNEYLGETRDIHQMAVAPQPGPHRLTLVDEHGELLERKFTVLTK